MSKILVIEDDEGIRSNVLDLLEAEDLQGIGAADGRSGIALAVQHLPDLIICDVMMPEIDGYGVLEILSQRAETAAIPFIFLSARAERADVRRGMAQGADDYLTKPFTRVELLEAIRARILRRRRSEAPIAQSSEPPGRAIAATGPALLVPRAEPMRVLWQQLQRVAPSTISVLILGETGVGKEMIAEEIHRASRRKGRFVAVNCAALSEGVLESELFGHEKGAFTGAHAAKEGLFELAHGGTLFLDEVGDMPMATQVKLLRALETRTVTRVGGRSARAVDVRFVAATNRDVEADAGKDGPFRRDLFFRLNGITLRVPPLRERHEDIEDLAKHFVALNGRALGRTVPATLTEEALQLLKEYPWPGNIRELRNVIERAVLIAEGERIQAADLSIQGHRKVAASSLEGAANDTDERARLIHELSEVERRRIVDALTRCAGNQTMAAELLGISRRTLVTRLHAYDLPRPRRRG